MQAVEITFPNAIDLKAISDAVALLNRAKKALGDEFEFLLSDDGLEVRFSAEATLIETTE